MLYSIINEFAKAAQHLDASLSKMLACRFRRRNGIGNRLQTLAYAIANRVDFWCRALGPGARLLGVAHIASLISTTSLRPKSLAFTGVRLAIVVGSPTCRRTVPI